MTRIITRRTFVWGSVAAGIVTAAPWIRAQGPRRPYVSLNGSVTRQMAWPDFARLASKLGYGGVDVNFNAAKTDGADATNALLKELKLHASVCNLPVPYASADDAAFQDAMKVLDENGTAGRRGTRVQVACSTFAARPRAWQTGREPAFDIRLWAVARRAGARPSSCGSRRPR